MQYMPHRHWHLGTLFLGGLLIVLSVPCLIPRGGRTLTRNHPEVNVNAPVHPLFRISGSRCSDQAGAILSLRESYRRDLREVKQANRL